MSTLQVVTPRVCALFIASVAVMTTSAHAQQHGAGIAKICESPRAVGETTRCEITVSYADGFGDTLEIMEAYDIVDPGPGGANTRVPAVGNLEIIAVGGNTTATIGGTLPVLIGPANSTLSGLPGNPQPGFVIFIQDTYVVQSGDPNPLPDQASVMLRDLCDEVDTAGCSMSPNLIQFTSATTLIPEDDEKRDRVSGTEKGSLLIYSKVEIRWNAAGELIQDTFVDLTNDLGQQVDVNMYFINGDPPLAADGGERSHPDWNWVDVKRPLTANQPSYWSALTGGPGPDGAPVAPFTVLDPSNDPLQQGRPATDGSSDRVLRGYIIAFAVDEDCCPVSWNHLKGDATLVNYEKSTAWEYNAWAFQEACDKTPGTNVGTCEEENGELPLNGLVYVEPYALLLLDFYAPGSDALRNQSGMLGDDITVDTSLTLHPVDADLRQEGAGPLGTKASFVIWNEDETQFTNLHRCITCWDQTLLSLYTDGGLQNHFLNLQTDKGKARIDGIASQLCSSNCCFDRSGPGCADFDCQQQVCDIDPACCSVGTGWDQACAELAVDICDVCDSLQVNTPLLGVAAKHISFGNTYDDTGLMLTGMGEESTSIYYDPAGGGGVPPTSIGDPADTPLRGAGLGADQDNDLGDGTPPVEPKSDPLIEKRSGSVSNGL